MKKPISLLLAMLMTGCFLRPNWHWEKAGASEADYATELNRCKQQTYTGTDGMVTQAMVQRMHGCMQAAGWQKVAN